MRQEQDTKTGRLGQQQTAGTAELPEDYGVVAFEPSAPMVRWSSWEVIRIQQNGRLTAAAIAARRRLATAASDYRRDV
jgi:hypothetical protein